MRTLNGLNGLRLLMAKMCVPVRQGLAGNGGGGDHHEHRREKVVSGTAIHTSQAREYPTNVVLSIANQVEPAVRFWLHPRR